MRARCRRYSAQSNHYMRPGFLEPLHHVHACPPPSVEYNPGDHHIEQRPALGPHPCTVRRQLQIGVCRPCLPWLWDYRAWSRLGQSRRGGRWASHEEARRSVSAASVHARMHNTDADAAHASGAPACGSSDGIARRRSCELAAITHGGRSNVFLARRRFGEARPHK